MTANVLATKLFFLETQPTNPHKALDLLFSEALPLVPEISREKLLVQFEDLRKAWSSKILLEGEEEVRTRAISFWDALILQAAESSGAAILYSEDLTAGRKYGSVRVVNPLADAASTPPDR